MTVSASSHLTSVQALRGLAALAVVLLHVSGLQVEEDLLSDAGLARHGWIGVDLFFVISGFIMVWVTKGAINGAETARRFFLMRLIRIYPLWMVSVTLLAVFYLLANGSPAHPAEVPRSEAWLHYGQSLFLVPHDRAPLLVVGWTLIHELYFYAVFALMIWAGFHQRPLIAMLAWGLITGLGVSLQWNVSAPVLAILFNPLTYYFMAGAGIAAFVLRLTTPRLGLVSLVTGVALMFALIGSGVIDKSDRVIQLIVPLTLLLYGAVALERSGSLQSPRWLIWLGDISYSLYLTHLLVVIGWRVFLKPFYDGGALSSFSASLPEAVVVIMDGAFVLTAALIVAHIFHRFIEQPSLRYLRSRFSGYRQA